jgi:hypothetical protein
LEEAQAAIAFLTQNAADFPCVVAVVHLFRRADFTDGALPSLGFDQGIHRLWGERVSVFEVLPSTPPGGLLGSPPFLPGANFLCVLLSVFSMIFR